MLKSTLCISKTSKVDCCKIKYILTHVFLNQQTISQMHDGTLQPFIYIEQP